MDSLHSVTLPLWSDEPGSAGSGSGNAPRKLTLVRLAAEIARQVATIGVVSVEGEVHRPATGRTGWVYFNLRDRVAEVRVVVPPKARRATRIVGGQRVCVVGSLEWVSDRANLQLKATEVTPVGAGAIAAMLAETRRKLTSDGLIGRPGRELPGLPNVIGVVCGADAAVRHDIESVVALRFPGYPMSFRETTVSGPGAADSIIRALSDVSSQDGVEVVILARGGGDATQLLPWSDELVCRSVAACPVPVISAIGHENDRPLCDEVADLRCGTPSLAASAAIPDLAGLETALERWSNLRRRELEATVERSRRRVAAVDAGGALRRGVSLAEERLTRSRRHLDEVHPQRHLRQARHRLEGLDWRRRAGEQLGRARGRWEAEGRHLHALSPERVLARGYAVASLADGAVVRSPQQVSLGDELKIRVAGGRISTTVESTDD